MCSYGNNHAARKGDANTLHELRRRIAEYRRVREMTTDKQFLENIDRTLAETEELLRQLEADQGGS